MGWWPPEPQPQLPYWWNSMSISNIVVKVADYSRLGQVSHCALFEIDEVYSTSYNIVRWDNIIDRTLSINSERLFLGTEKIVEIEEISGNV